MTTSAYRMRRAQTKERLEEGTWPDLDKIRFEFAVKGKGQGIIGPMMFGRAYDSPPHFSHSIVAEAFYQSGPRLTVGVAEWIRDEQGMYVGATLWVRLDSTWCNDPRRLTTSCKETLILGENILKDPGFENQVNIPIGPFGMTFPGEFTAGGTLSWNVDNVENRLYYDTNGWAVWANNLGASPSATPELSTANPRSGTYHWRITFLAGEGGGNETYPIPIGGSYCALQGGVIRAYSARCDPGMTVRYSQHMMVSNTTDGPFEVFGEMRFFDKDNVFVEDNVGPTSNLTTSYVKYEYSRTAPPGAYTVAIEFEIANSYSPTVSPTHFDVDDAVLEVSHS